MAGRGDEMSVKGDRGFVEAEPGRRPRDVDEVDSTDKDDKEKENAQVPTPSF